MQQNDCDYCTLGIREALPIDMIFMTRLSHIRENEGQKLNYSRPEGQWV